MKRKITLSTIWALFVILFFMLGFYHWNASKSGTPHFKISERPFAGGVSSSVAGADIDQPIRDFVADFNSYIDEKNKTSTEQNQRTAYGYWAASLAAILSMVLVWKE